MLSSYSGHAWKGSISKRRALVAAALAFLLVLSSLAQLLCSPQASYATESQAATEDQGVSAEHAVTGSIWEGQYAPGAIYEELTDAERSYLAGLRSIKMGFVTKNLPISGTNESGDASGVAYELIAPLEATLETDIEPIAFDTTILMIEALQNGDIDIAFPVFSDPLISQNMNILLTGYLISDRAMIAYKGEYREGLMNKVAVSETALGQRFFIASYSPESEIVIYPDRTSCFNSVINGDTASVIGAASVLQRFILEHPEYENLNIAYLDDSENFSIGISEKNPMLATIMKKVAAQIDSSFINDAMIRHSYYEAPVTLMNVINHYALWIILFWIALFTVMAIIFYKYSQKARAFNREQAQMRAALEDALAAADNASEAKTSFLSKMSHDIRTPMNGIIGMTAIAAANIDNKQRVEDCLAKITTSSKHLLALINEILDVSKIESGKIELTEERFSLSEMIDDLMTINRPLAEAKKLAMGVHAIDVNDENVIGDRTRLQQVFTNLVSNAIKYTPENGEIDITLMERDSGNPKVKRYDFIVKDTGIGISEEYLPHIFEAFTRDDRKAISAVQGSGLGMPIAQSIARMMNGDIKVVSEVGAGSTFTATVFLKLADPDDATYEDLVDLNILVVDDEEDVCESTCLILSELGMNAESTTSGAEAVEMVVKRNQEGNDYFAIILDWVMPEMDGLETLKVIRERVDENIPIIVVSAYDWSEIEFEARKAGAVTFIGKPLFKSRLVNMFSELLGKEEISSGRGLKEIAGDASFSGKRALMVEDNDLNAEIAIDFLGMTGLEMERAVNGKEAVEMVERSAPGYYDCIFMDVQMPVMNGIDAAKAIRALNREDASKVPIFAMTADAFVDDIKATKDAGMNEHFSKPIDFDDVVVTLKKYLG